MYTFDIMFNQRMRIPNKANDLLAFLVNEIFERWDVRMNLDLIFRSL